MNILAIVKMVPDVVEELEIAPDGKSLDAEMLRLILNERDAHAVEEALLLKERHGGQVIVLGLDAPELDEALYTALAKGVDRACKVTGGDVGFSAEGAASRMAQVLKSTAGLWPADVVLIGVQAIDDLDGLVAPQLAHRLGLPYLGIVTQVTPDSAGKTAKVVKEYPGGIHGEFEVSLPAVLGIQTAEKAPRYVPVAKVRAAMKSQKIESLPAPGEMVPALVEVLELCKPEAVGHAEMIEGGTEQMAGKLYEILAEHGVV